MDGEHEDDRPNLRPRLNKALRRLYAIEVAATAYLNYHRRDHKPYEDAADMLNDELMRDELGDALAAALAIGKDIPVATADLKPEPLGTDILRTRVCPECESVIQSGINRCPRCSGE